MTIHGSIGSCATRSLRGAWETGVAFSWRPVNTLDGSNRSPGYPAIDPSAKIRAMKNGDIVLTESLAINQYLAVSYSGLSQWLSDCRSRWLVHQWAFWSATEI